MTKPSNMNPVDDGMLAMAISFIVTIDEGIHITTPFSYIPTTTINTGLSGENAFTDEETYSIHHTGDHE